MNSAKTVTVFFYGLFMDVDLLAARGFTPTDIRRASLHDFELRIGQRATLVERKGSTVHGMVMRMRTDELDRLYADPTLTQYEPVTVGASVGAGEQVEALTYVLSQPPGGQEANPEYAAKLRDLCRRLSFPSTYIESIR